MSVRLLMFCLPAVIVACPAPSGEAPKAAAGQPVEAPAKVEAKVEAKAEPPAAGPSRRRQAQESRGKGAVLEKEPVEQRRAFWAAIQDGRKRTAAKDYAGAIASFDAALQQLPDHPRALSGRGYARLLAGELEAAEADLRRALAAPGTKKLEAAIAFNLGLVAEKRGDAALARAQFSLANTLNPSKAAADKLAGGSACPVTLEYDKPESKLFSDWRETWQHFADQGAVDAEKKPADEAAAKQVVCTSEALLEGQQDTFDACARTPGGPWLVKHYFDVTGHALFVIEPADAGQIRVTELGIAGGGRCGALDDASIVGDNPALVLWKVTEGVSIDVMENDKGEIVDCEPPGDCFSSCGSEEDGTFAVFVFSSRTVDPTSLHGPQVNGAPAAEVTIDGDDVVVKGGGCDFRAPIRNPKN